MSPRAFLLDLEGTTTAISFVKDVLFPYANDNAEKFLTEAWDREDVQAAVEGMRQQSVKDVEANVEGAIPIPSKESSKEEQITGIAKNMKWLNDIGNKGTYLKELSGHIWQFGYDKGDIKGHLFDDVHPAIQNWKKDEKKLYIYSSGSVLAQKLLMKYSNAGDLESLFDGFFDTAVGHKREASSYRNILEKIDTAASDLLFLTDIEEEADAASEAGINAMLLSREGNGPLSDKAKETYTVVSSFAEIDTATTLKRKSADDENMPPAKISKTEDVPIDNGAAVKDAAEDAPMEVDTPAVENGKIETEVKPVDDKPDEPMEEKTEVTETIETVKSDDKTEQSSIDVVTNDTIASETETTIEEVKDAPPVEAVVDKTETTVNGDSVADKAEPDTPTSLPNPEIAIDDEKLDEILGEKGIALEKECEEILNKVDEVTTAQNDNGDVLLDVEKNSAKDLDDLAEILPELPSVLESTEVKPTDEPNNVTVEVEDPKPETPVPETNGDKSKEPAELNGAKSEEPAEVNGAKSEEPAEINGGKSEEPAEVNGSEKTETMNGNGEHMNGENGNGIEEVNGKNGDDKTTAEVETKSDSVETTEEPAEIKVKKITTDEAIVEQKAVET